MSGGISPRGGITRRGFVKGAAAVGAIGALAGGMATTSDWLAPAKAAAEPEERIACTFHQGHCGSVCSLKCTVRDGRLVMVQPNDKAVEPRYRTVCLRGISEVQHIYGQKRVQTPLKRVGERGSGEFEQVSWEEALDDIGAQIKAIQSKYGRDSVLVNTSGEVDAPWLAGILGARTCANNDGVDIGIGNGLDPATGAGGGYAMSGQEARDWVNSKLVLNVGCNFCESSMTTSRLLFEAMDAGARTIAVDPHFSTTACKCDEWVPIEPGTDAALFLGMVTAILDNDLQDEEFMKKHTSFPFLVDEGTGQLLREHEGRVDEETGEPEDGTKNPYMVIGADGGPVPYTEASNPRLEGTVSVSGSRATTVYSLLLRAQREYTLDWASQVTGIPAEKIEEIARLYAEGPSSLSLGWGGNDKISNADVAGHAAAILVAITGNIGKKGAGVGVYVGGNYNGYSAPLGSWEASDELEAGPSDLSFYDIREQGSVHAVFTVGDFLAQKVANMGRTEKWLEGIDLVVIADPYFTEHCKWADYVLPLTTRFELDDEYGNIKVGYNHIVMQQKVLDPLFEAKTELWLQRELASRLGVEAGLPEAAHLRGDAALSGSDDSYYSDLSAKDLLDNQGIWPIDGIDEPRMVFEDYDFETASGRMDVYYEDMYEFGQALPEWEPPQEAYAGNPLRETYPLQFANVRTRFRIHNQFNDAEWIQQFYTPTIAVNPADVAGKGIESGDVVRVFNDRGSMKLPIHLNEAVRPGSARMYEGATSDYVVEGNMQELTNDSRLERGSKLMVGPVAPFSDTLVAIEKA